MLELHCVKVSPFFSKETQEEEHLNTQENLPTHYFPSKNYGKIERK